MFEERSVRKQFLSAPPSIGSTIASLLEPLVAAGMLGLFHEIYNYRMDGVAMALSFPLMFLSGIFVPVAGLPAPLRQFAEFNPLTALATALRRLFGVATGPLPGAWPLQHPVLASVAWALGLLAVFVPLSVRRYRRMSY